MMFKDVQRGWFMLVHNRLVVRTCLCHSIDMSNIFEHIVCIYIYICAILRVLGPAHLAFGVLAVLAKKAHGRVRMLSKGWEKRLANLLECK